MAQDSAPHTDPELGEPPGVGDQSWEVTANVQWGLKVAKIGKEHIDPLKQRFGSVKDDLLYTYFKFEGRLGPANNFLHKMDGAAPGRISCLGRWGSITAMLWICSVPIMAFGFWRWGDCRHPDWPKEDYPKCWDLDWCAILGPLLAFPGYIGDILLFEKSVVRIINMQWEATLILAQATLGCVLLSHLCDFDTRMWIIWFGVFLGIFEVTFSDAVPADCVSTKTKISMFALFAALPFLLLIWIGLKVNQESNSWDLAATSMFKLPLTTMVRTYSSESGRQREVIEHEPFAKEEALGYATSFFQALILLLAKVFVTASKNLWRGTREGVLLKVKLERCLVNPVEDPVEDAISAYSTLKSDQKLEFEKRITSNPETSA